MNGIVLLQHSACHPMHKSIDIHALSICYQYGTVHEFQCHDIMLCNIFVIWIYIIIMLLWSCEFLCLNSIAITIILNNNMIITCTYTSSSSTALFYVNSIIIVLFFLLRNNFHVGIIDLFNLNMIICTIIMFLFMFMFMLSSIFITSYHVI